MATENSRRDIGVTTQRSVAEPEGARMQAFQRLVSEIFRLNGELLAAGERLGKDLGMSPARWQALATIRNEPLTVADIARRLGLTRQSVQRTINALRRDGLVRTLPNPGHRRSHLIELTPDGDRAWQQLRDRQVPLTDMFTEGLGLTAPKLEQIAEQLRVIRKTAEDIGH